MVMALVLGHISALEFWRTAQPRAMENALRYRSSQGFGGFDLSLIHIYPRITWLSSRADYHLRVRPGTDAALAMAMLNTIIQEDLSLIHI